MAKINVLTAFTIRLAREGEEVIRRVEAGVQEVEDFIAEHWYAKAHTGPLPETFGDSAGSQSDATDQAAVAAAAKASLQAESDRLDKLRAELDTFGKGLDDRAAALDTREAAVAASEQDLAARVAAFDAAQKDAPAVAKDGAADGAAQKSGSGKKA
ncbi:TPA: STY1053 family phage-associated protein [Burkholderia cepacia]